MSQTTRTHRQTPSERSIERSNSETPRNPPGLPLPADRLWQPHEDAYWKKLREQWGSTLDLNDMDEAEDTKGPGRSGSDDRQRTDLDDDSTEDMDDVDLTTANGTVFRIVLADGGQITHEHDIHRPRRSTTPTRTTPDLGSRGLNMASPGDVPYPSAAVRAPPRPISRALDTHLPPLAHTKTNKKPRKFQAPTLSVSVTTTTRTYSGDIFPPPYTPRPTGTERSFGVDGKFTDEMEPSARWPVAKWLFILGFLFPLLWLFGSFLLFSGLRKMADSSPASSIESQVSDRKLDTQSRDTTTINSKSPSSITHLIAQEVVWSKRCAWAISIFAVCCFTALGVLKAVGM